MRPLLLLIASFVFVSGFSQSDPVKDQVSKVDFKSIDAHIAIDPVARSVKGEMKLLFDVIEIVDSVYIDARNMKFSGITLNGKNANFRNDNNRIWLIERMNPSENNEIHLNYSAIPSQTMYFINWDVPSNMDVRRQVWTQGQGRYTSHWLPSFDDTREKVIFNLSYSFYDNYTVISNGVLEDIIQVNDSVKRWNFSMEKPMSSYLVAVAAGDYETQKFKTSTGIPVEHFYEPRDKQKLKWTYNHSLEIFEFLEKEIGVPYPWQNYKQIPVQDFLHSGMENTGATIFSSAFVIDSIGFNDRNYVNVNAHELAHQWFGNYVTAFDNEHHWLQEGFSTYYALLAEKQIFGENYYYWRLYESAEQLKALSDTGKGEALINLKAGSLTVYQKGAWALHILNELIGEKAFKTAVRDYLLQHAYGSVTTQDFLNAAEKASGVDLSGYEAEWLKQSAFQGTAALSSLKQSAFTRNFMEVAALREIPVINKMGQLENALSFPVNDYTGQEAVFQLSDAPITETIKLYRKAFESGNLYVRQAIALSMETIPKELKSDFISLLDDASYITIENALMKLWLQYPDETARWLAKTKGIEGLPNKNVKMLWLLINLVSPGGEREDLQKYYEELSSYTRPYHPFEVRQNAFGYLYQINTFSRENLIDLLQAGQHHNFRFRDYSRKLLTELLKNEDYRLRYEELGVELNSKDRDFLNSRLKPLHIK